MTNSINSGKLQAMVREFSAGGVVIRKREGVWWMAAIEPPQEPDSGNSKSSNSQPCRRRAGKRSRLTLPKGLIDPGEKPLDAALREVREETGVTAVLIAKLADIKYVYVRSWGDGARVFKIVSFYLLRYESGRINAVAAEMRIEVERALWIPLDEAPSLLSYKGERDVARRALEYVKAHSEL